MKLTGTISFDFDGVLSEDRQGDGAIRRTDFEGIREALRRGYSVAVSTCASVWKVAGVLRTAGFEVLEDRTMHCLYWQGQGDLILVTNRKVCADIHIDDRAWRHKFGEPWGPVFRELEIERERQS